jgi:hypothetical protein
MTMCTACPTGHHEVQREEDLRVAGLFPFELTRQPRDVVLEVLRVVLEGLDAEEHAPKRHGEHEEDDQRSAPGHLRGLDRQRHRQAAGDENGRVRGYRPTRPTRGFRQ